MADVTLENILTAIYHKESHNVPDGLSKDLRQFLENRPKESVPMAESDEGIIVYLERMEREKVFI